LRSLINSLILSGLFIMGTANAVTLSRVLNSNPNPNSDPCLIMDDVAQKVADDKLELLSSGDSPHKAVIFVGGIHCNYTYFNEWVPYVSAPDSAVFGFNHDHQSETMTVAGHSLAQDILDLRAKGFDDITVIAHSMGGLVSKAALNELVRDGHANEFKQIQLSTFGTPYGGFILADLALVLPGAEMVSKAIHLPMGPEMGPHSSFLKSLAMDWPANMEFNVYRGLQDTVSTPETAATENRYAAITRHANTLADLEETDHVGYRSENPKVLLAAKGEPVPGMTTVEIVRAEPGSKQSDSQASASNATEKVAQNMEVAMSR